MSDNKKSRCSESGALQGMRILLVDDNSLFLQVATMLVESGGAAVVTAGNGKEAIAQLRRDRFDCVLMDVEMPVMDGIAAIRQIRAEPAIAHVRVVAMTGNASGYIRDKCLAMGMDDFITKPLGRKALLSLLANCCPD